jgi:hypothetical protein
MFAFAFMLAIASFVFEMMLAAKIPAWRQNAKRNKIINLVLSVLLSFIMGVLFGAAGLIVMTAAIISTLMSVPGYAFLYWNYDSPQAQARGGNQIQHMKVTTIKSYRKFKQAFVDLANMIYKIIRVITFPIWGTRALKNKINARRT